MSYVAWFANSTKGIRLNIAVRILAGLVQAIIDLYVVWLSRQFIDTVIPEGSGDDIFRAVLWLFASVSVAVLLRVAYYYLTVKAGVVQSNSVRARIYNRLFSTPLYTGKSLHSGDVASRLAKDIELVSEVSTDILPQILIIGGELLGAFLLLHYFDARLAWLLLVVTPLTVASAKFISYRLRTLTHGIRDEESRIQMQVQESIEQNAVLRSLGSRGFMAKTLENMHNALLLKTMRRTRFMVIIRVLMGLTFSLGYMAAFVWGGLQLKNGSITFGTMTSFLQLVGLVQSPIYTLLNFLPKVAQSTASIDRLEQMKVSPDEEAPSATPSDKPVGIDFKDVSFRYSDNGEMVIDGFSHSFAPGSKTAVSGRTGIGKTTLFRLMLAFIKPSAGKITISAGGSQTPLTPALRSNFVFVPQGNTLISGTIRFNLLIADPSANDQRLKDVLHTACADFVFDMPLGIDTLLGERGGGLSEGQAQRIAIARGLLRRGQVFLLDEISSALDEQTEKELYRRMFEAYPDKTMIFITHRPSLYGWCSAKINID